MRTEDVDQDRLAADARQAGTRHGIRALVNRAHRAMTPSKEVEGDAERERDDRGALRDGVAASQASGGMVDPGHRRTRAGRARGISCEEDHATRPHQWWARRRKTFDRLMEARNVPPKRKEVAWRLCLGDSDKEIGHRFGLTRDGVASHIRLLFPTFCVRDRHSFRRTVAEQMDRESPDQPLLVCTQLSTSRRESVRLSSVHSPTLIRVPGERHGAARR